ncbi:Histidine kinase [Desulfamplus magnetovallimortis]|uniref:histidine kinase n=1 Tax=Desulfamplus magnetovallimortis TaxID=1246637 RepID=A0A1W1HH70_9BACT|nr:HAMP domain-containing sensor histidine kinase [Desulfamplus magnetovallimortis]SLM31765.1 Histidine kinase [Desulfamplus magnetovallimortis]
MITEDEKKNDTFFAPPGRADRRKLKNQINSISYSPVMSTLLKSTGGVLVIINENRQLVAMNNSFLESLGIKDPEAVIGLRLGESLNCIHAFKEPDGCGTTPHCSSCGAAIAMMSAIKDEKPDEQICTLTSNKNGLTEDICLLIRAEPLIVDNNKWILIYAQDITRQQFWINLERIFFHDINNTLGALQGYTNLLLMEIPDDEIVKKINYITERLTKEISLQKSLSYHKDTSFTIQKKQIKLKDIKDEINLIIREHESAIGKKFSAEWNCLDFRFRTDPILVTRVLGNMIINALEATDEGCIVTLKTEIAPSHIEWKVWNKQHIPQKMHTRIFQKHYTTKSSPGRGLGTYSMKLFGESYLKGGVGFHSSEKKGTTFFFRLPL